MFAFPENCIRGIKENKNISNDGTTVLAALFLPAARTAQTRDDGHTETSINWEDNESVLSFTLNYRLSQNAYFAYPNGAVKIPREKIDEINTFNGTKDGVFANGKQLKVTNIMAILF